MKALVNQVFLSAELQSVHNQYSFKDTLFNTGTLLGKIIELEKIGHKQNDEPQTWMALESTI